MATTPNQKPVPSEDYVNMRFNAGKLDEFITSTSETYTDRLGQEHMTAEGIRASSDDLRSDLASSDAGDGASLIKTDKNRSAQDKFNESITPADFQAIGDGVTNDDAKFAALEGAIYANRINLDGKSYFVTKIPAANDYYNGSWVLSKTITVSTTSGAGTSYTYNVNTTAENHDSAIPASVVERDARGSQSKIAYKLTQANGLQGLCFDEANKKIYCMYFDNTSGSERTVVNRYSMNDYYPALAVAELTTLPSSQLGHQGLSIELVTNSEPKLWGSVRYDATNFPLGHRQAIRFNASTDGSAITNVQAYTLFGSDFNYLQNNGNSTMAAVSYDQRWLVATGRKTSRDFWVRVFDLHKLANGGAGDYSNSWEYQFNIDNDILADDPGGLYTPIQNVACDGAFVYIVAGNATQQQKKIHQYTIYGKRVGRNNTVSVGLTQAQADGTFYEPEALALSKPVGQQSPSLNMLIVTGPGAGHSNYVYEMGSGPRIYSGSWTPTITNVTNVTASTAFVCHFMRIDNVVTFSGRVNVQSTATGATNFRLSLPVFIIGSSLTQVQGLFNDQTTQGGRIQLDTTSGLMDFMLTAALTTNTSYSFSGSLRVIN